MFFLSTKRQKEAPVRREEREVLTTNWQKTRSPTELPEKPIQPHCYANSKNGAIPRKHDLSDFGNEKEKVAPRPGFGPGSCGRQPHILDRTILPGLKRRLNTLDFG